MCVCVFFCVSAALSQNWVAVKELKLRDIVPLKGLYRHSMGIMEKKMETTI